MVYFTKKYFIEIKTRLGMTESANLQTVDRFILMQKLFIVQEVIIALVRIRFVFKENKKEYEKGKCNNAH